MGRYYKIFETLANQFGVENVRVHGPGTITRSMAFLGLPIGISAGRGNSKEIYEFEIDESRYKVDDGYKICLRPVNQVLATDKEGNPTVYIASDTFYQMDLRNMMARNPELRWITVRKPGSDVFEKYEIED